jgi:D-alanyl-D-alanine carboxypeptidase/D-alanyl-D-alanine-endopeptidase (penicillin-binding protein 4)
MLVGATVLVVIGLTPPDAAPGPTRAATLGTPLWSLRRLPQAVIDATGAQQLQAALANRTRGLQSCTVVRDDTTGADLSASGTQPLTPASTMKLLTATAALSILGPDFHFTTTAVADDPVRDGAVDRLFLVGGGDPLLATPERIALDQRDPDTAGLPSSSLATLADRIVAAGVRRIPGGVVGIDDRYDRTRVVAGWSAGVADDIGPVGALTVNDGRAGAAGTGANVADPAVNAAAELSRLLAARGVAVGPAARADHAPAAATRIATLDSPPLPEVLEELLSASDNLSAEMLTRELGADAGSGTTARGVQAIRDELTKLHVDLSGATFVDGSGLAHDNRLTCTTLLDVLTVDARPRFGAVADGLAIAGRRGTLALSLRGTPLEDNLRAKTGTLAGVSGLAGFVRSDRPLTFALLLGGGFGQNAGYALREGMAADIAAYPAVTDAATLVPEPNAPIPASTGAGNGTRACRTAEPAC